MKLDQLRKIIREEVRSAVKEELQDVMNEAVKFASAPYEKPVPKNQPRRWSVWHVLRSEWQRRFPITILCDRQYRSLCDGLTVFLRQTELRLHTASGHVPPKRYPEDYGKPAMEGIIIATYPWPTGPGHVQYYR